MCETEKVVQVSKRRETKLVLYPKGLIKLVLILMRNKCSKLKNAGEIFGSEEPDVNNRAEFPNRSFMIDLVYFYLDRSFGVGNRLQEVRHGKLWLILDKQQILSFPQRVQTGCGSHLTSYSSGTVSSVTDDETTGGETGHYV